MKVLVLGGTGVFGSRLVRLLVRDGHNVTIAARNLASARALANELGCSALQMNRDGDLAALSGHDVLVDAAGPFHAYGADPYRLAKAALAAGCTTLTCPITQLSARVFARWTLMPVPVRRQGIWAS